MRSIRRARLAAAVVGVVAGACSRAAASPTRASGPASPPRSATPRSASTTSRRRPRTCCELRAEDPASEGDQPVSGAEVRDLALQTVVLREIADQLAEEYDVESGRPYDDAWPRSARQLEGLDEDLVDRAVRQPVRHRLLRRHPDPGWVARSSASASPTTRTASRASRQGIEIAQQWPDESAHRRPTRATPAWRSATSDEGVLTTRDDISAAVSDFARDALGAAEDPLSRGPGVRRLAARVPALRLTQCPATPSRSSSR